MQKDISADQGSCDDPADSATPPDRRAAYHTLDADLRPRRMCRIPSEKYHRRPACVFMVASMASRRILALIKDHATIRRTLRSCPDRRGAYHTLDADLRPRRVCRIESVPKTPFLLATLGAINGS